LTTSAVESSFSFETISEHESAEGNNMFLSDHCCSKKCISMRTSPRTFAKEDLPEDLPNTFISFEIIFYNYIIL
jgi:hypothetical protein